MPIDLYSTAKKTSQWAFGSPFLNKILGSSLFVAGVVALLMVLLIMVMYPAKTGTSFSIVVKMFIYMFFGSLLVIFLHDGVVRYIMEDERQNLAADSFMQNATQGGREYDPSYGSLYKPINPMSRPSVSGSDEDDHHAEQASMPVLAPTPPPAKTPIVSIAESSVVTGGAPAKWKPRPPEKNPYR